MENSASDVFKCKMCKQGKQTMKRCTRCREVYYCSRECQAKDWPVHRTMCSVTGENSTTGKKWTENSVSVKFTTDDGSIIEQNQTLSGAHNGCDLLAGDAHSSMAPDSSSDVLEEKIPTFDSTIGQGFVGRVADQKPLANEDDSTAEDDGNSSYSPVIDFKKYANNKEPATSNKVNQDSSIKGTFYIENDRIYRNFPVLDKSQEYTDIVVKANRQKQIIGIQKSWDGGGIYRVLSHWLQIPLDKLKVIHKGKILKADNIRECVQKKAIFQVFGEKAEDSSGVDDRDIELMMKQLKVSRNEAILALKEHGDVVDAILGAGQK